MNASMCVCLHVCICVFACDNAYVDGSIWANTQILHCPKLLPFSNSTFFKGENFNMTLNAKSNKTRTINVERSRRALSPKVILYWLLTLVFQTGSETVGINLG